MLERGELLTMISIHALREEGDDVRLADTSNTYISIHALREEGDTERPAIGRHGKNFYPRPPRGGRPEARGLPFPTSRISIHALREEGDSKNRDKISIFKQIIQHSARI